MLGNTPAKYGRGIGGSRRRSILELLACILGGKQIAVAVGLLTCFGLEGLWASTLAVPYSRLTVHPNGATVAANQTQHFEVTDAQGRSVAVHWNISGLGCSGLACGTIDDQGVYRTPSLLPQPRVVILEGVLVSDPNYSVLTQIQLEDPVAVTVSPTSADVATGKTQEFTALVVGRQNLASRAELPPLPDAVAAAPVLARQNLASRAGLPPLPDAVAAALAAGRQNVASSAELPPLPDAVAAAPVVGGQNVASSAVLLPLPDEVSAAPAGTVVSTQYGLVWVRAPSPVQAEHSSAGSWLAAAEAPRDAPVVTYRDGQLTIDAENSTLAAVLELVAEKTGAVIEIPPGSGLERIVEHTGPGRAEDVLASLLNGSPFDFVIVGSPQPSHDPVQVLLSLHAADTPASLPPQLPKTPSSASLWTPPQDAPAEAAVPYDLDSRSFQPPKEPLSPEVRGQMMRDRAQQLLEKLKPQ